MSKRFNRDDIDKFHDYNLYIPTKTMYIGSENYDVDGNESGVDGAMAERAIKNLSILDSINPDMPITIVSNNIGGEEYAGLAIYDAVRACKSKVIIKAMGHCMSMGSIIFQSADERIMAPNARQMLHYGNISLDHHAKTFQKWADEYKKLDEWMENMYLEKIREKHKDFKMKTLKQMLNHDTILTAEESIELGLADKILGDENE